MKKFVVFCSIIVILLLSALLFGFSPQSTGSISRIARIEFPQVSWDTGDGHTAQTTTVYNMSMLVERVDVIISSVTGDPNVTLSFADENVMTIISASNFTDLDDGTSYLKTGLSSSPDFTPVPVMGDVTITVDPSADPGGVAQTLTVDIIFYGPGGLL